MDWGDLGESPGYPASGKCACSRGWTEMCTSPGVPCRGPWKPVPGFGKTDSACCSDSEHEDGDSHSSLGGCMRPWRSPVCL